MKKLFTLFIVLCTIILSSCGNFMAQTNYEREQQTAKYQSEYARTVNKLEMKEGNFETYRRIVFYNVRLGETVFACEGYCHVQVDKDGDIELVVKVDEDEYLRHYLGQKQDITYFSEQLKPTKNIDNYRYKIVFNPKIWIPTFDTEL